MVFTGLQMLSFPLALVDALPWQGTAVAPIGSLVAVIAGRHFAEQTARPVLMIFTLVAVCWMFGFLLVCALTVLRASNKSAAEILLPLVRTISGLSTTVLFLPVCILAANAFVCPSPSARLGPGWLGYADLACGGGGSILIRVCIAVLFTAYHALLLFVAAVHFDRNPASPSWSAMSHGQVDAAMLVVKVALVLCYSVLREVVLDSWVLIVVLLVAGAAWLGSAMKYLPYVHPGINALQVGCASVYLWCTLVLALERYASIGNQALLLYFGAALAGGGGFLGCYLREIFIASQPLEACETLVDLDVWARYRMQGYAIVVA